MKNKLIELLNKHKLASIYPLKDNYSQATIAKLADYLLENGVVAPKFKVGDKVWYLTGIHRTLIKSAIVDEIIINCNGVSDLFVTSDTGSFENSVDIFYSTKEEAEQKLAEMNGYCTDKQNNLVHCENCHEECKFDKFE